MKVIAAGTAECLPEGDMRAKVERAIAKDKPLKIKFGVDPTRPDLHLGHAVPLRKLRQFQELGHTAILLIGDFTALVGDPSARDITRPQLSVEEVRENAETYAEQAFHILDKDKTVLDYNSRWLAPLTFEELLRLTAYFTVARLLEREDFSKRYSECASIGLHEFLYPVMQAYDSVALEADVEIGGTDQIFNLLAGRELQKALGQEPQTVLTLPILVGLDGEKKMSKSLGNHIGLTDPPEEMFGKLMSLADELMPEYFRLASGEGPYEIEEILRNIESADLHPARAKRRLAGDVVKLYWDEKSAKAAEERFDRVHKERERPDDIPDIQVPAAEFVDGKIWIPRLLVLANLAASTSEGRRLINQKGIRIAEEIVENPDLELPADYLDGEVIQKGKRHFRRIKLS
ncbi:MAG: tyrosine--tRNA ligase [Candidatus Solincola sediminis]|uniref:Tyrosine--tRNA ligase n=1 Tax=Candidatus Solincola sediminis TaxID=1797199 RepID=A0A1F2WSQ0_9ACTN|nr:MAG: tyrosine--tRNA ligase [Candidatus Solincola sediminis]OFW60973.1 MAG: tyrosine--tRNA ligase [Candidatus Solincola sediminis]